MSVLYVSNQSVAAKNTIGVRHPLKIQTGPKPEDAFLVTGLHSDETEPYLPSEVQFVVTEKMNEYRATEQKESLS